MKKSKIIAVLDACVLYPAPVRDLLMRLATSGVYQAHWSEEIHKEWIRNVLKNRPDLTIAQLTRTRELMDKYAEDALVSEYEEWLSKINLPDPCDRHVVAVAIKAKADTIVTYNLKDFPASNLRKFQIRAIHPDELLKELIDKEEVKCQQTVKSHRKALKNPPKTQQEYLETLREQGLVKTALILEK